MRNVALKINTLLEIFPVVALIGPRQCGKTTLCKSLKPDWLYVDLENPLDWQRIAYDPNFFFQENPRSVIIDEAQLRPEIFRVLRGVIDAQRSLKGRFILTGSSSPELLTQLSESLAGRMATLELAPLTVNEMAHKPLSSFYRLFDNPLSKASCQELLSELTPISQSIIAQAVFQGGYPELTEMNSVFARQQWLNEYIRSYLYRDIAALFPGLNKEAYQRFILILAELSGTILNKAELARDIEVSEKTVRDYLMIAEGTFLWRNLPSFERSSRKALVKMPKGFVRDSGLLCHLSRLSTPELLLQSHKRGRVFEGFVIEELLRGLTATFATQWAASYYRTRNGAEIDLIVEGSFGMLPIEIKHGVTLDHRRLRVLEAFIQEFDCPFGLVINQSDTVHWLSERILQLPVAYL